VVTTAQPGAESPGTRASPTERRPTRPGAVSHVLQPAHDPGPPEEPAAALPHLAKIFGAIVAPTTLLTALLYYFGWSHAYWFFNYFGVNSTLLGFTTSDYLMRSVDALFVPMTVVACAAFLGLWGHSVLTARFAAGSRPRALRVLLPVTAILGCVLAIGGVASVFTATVLSRHLVAAPLSLGLGVLLLAYAAHLWRSLATERYNFRGSRGWAAVAEWAVVFVLVGLSLFWAATDYSAAVGRSRAAAFVADLPFYPSVVVYSQRSLSLHAPGVREVRCRDSQAAYRFRYDGLKLMLESGGQYLFVPSAWTPGQGVAILIPRSDSLRLEFFPAGAQPSFPRLAC
jgi:hypothetical protein